MLARLILATGVLIVGCSRLQSEFTSESIDIAEHLDTTFVPPDMSAAGVERAIQHAAQCDYAIVFVHVDWAFMDLPRKRYWEFVVAYSQPKVHPYTAFHYIDCTDISSDYALLRKIPGYKSLEDKKGASLHGGSGELMWIDHGVVVAVEAIPWTESREDLVSKTLSLWSTGNGT